MWEREWDVFGIEHGVCTARAYSKVGNCPVLSLHVEIDLSRPALYFASLVPLTLGCS